MEDPLARAIEMTIHHYWLLLGYGVICAVLGALALAGFCWCVQAGRADDEWAAMREREQMRRELEITDL